MKYMSLVGLCSLLLLIPACKDNCGTACCPPTTHTTTETATAAPAVEVQEEEFVETQQPTTVSVGSDKEDLEEEELVAVMDNK